MISDAVREALYDQINMEFASSYSYLSMSAYCAHRNFPGCAQWLRIQSQEENAHAMRLYDFMIARDCRVVLKAIAAPASKFETIADVFRSSLQQEMGVSASIDKLYELAHENKAFAAMVELQWFITEQVEEEKTVRDIVAKFEMVGADASALIDLDRELGARQMDQAVGTATPE